MKNTDLLKITFAPMNPKERIELEKKFKMMIPIGIFTFIIIGVVSYGMDFGLFTLLIDGLMIFAFGSIYRSFKLDLKENEKKIWQGLITDKDYTVRSNKNSKSTYTYYFYFGDQKRKIDKDIYDKFNVGDFIEIHLAKRVWSVYFETKLIKENAMPEVLAKYQNKPTTQAKKTSNKLGCYVFLIIALTLTTILLVLMDVIDIPLLKENILEFLDSL